MAVGDLVTLADQVEWRSRLINRSGATTGVLFLASSSAVEGLGVGSWDWSPDPIQKGSSLGAVALTSRVVSIAVMCSDDTALASLRASMVPTGEPEPLVWLGHGAGQKRAVYVVPAGCQETSTSRTRDGFRSVVCDWFAPDPRQLSLAETTTTISASNPTVANAGSWPAPWRAVVTGACTGPRFRDVSVSGRVLRFDDVTVPGGQTFTVDTRAQTAVLSGSPTVDRWHLGVDDAGRPTEPWGVPSGGCQVGFASASGASTAAFYSRGCWL